MAKLYKLFFLFPAMLFLAAGLAFPQTQPTPITPASNEAGVSIIPKFKWSCGAGTYNKFNIVVKEKLTNTSYDYTSATTDSVTYNYVSSIKLKNGILYNWKVRAYESSAGWSTFSEETQFKTTNAVIPILSSPSQGELLYSEQPVFSWSCGSAIAGIKFTVQVRPNDALFESPGTITASVEEGLNLTWPDALNLGTKYYWRVYSENINSGAICSYSPHRYFTMYGTPVRPVQFFPTPPAIIYTDFTTLSWGVPNGTAGLHFRFRYSSNGGAIWLPSSAGDSTDNLSATIYDLLPNKTYSWEVWSYNNSSSDTSVHGRTTFRTNNWGTTAPLAPIVLWPTGNPIVYSNEAMLSWYVTGSGEGLDYFIQYKKDTDENWTDVSFNSPYTYTYYNLPDLSYGTNYKWRVKAHNTAGSSAWSSEGSFNVFGSTNSIKPILDYPANNQTIFTNLPAFSWHSVGLGVAYYVVAVYNVTDVDPVEASGHLQETSWQMTQPLDNDKTYHWIVTAWGMNGSPSPSVTRYFKTTGSAGSLVPVPTAPKGGAVVQTNTPTLYWYVNGYSPNTLTYQVEIFIDNNTNEQNLVWRSGTDIPDQSVVVPGNKLYSGTTYYWQVKSYFSGGSSGFSAPLAKFTTAAGNGPVTVVNGSPGDGLMLSATAPVLSWYPPVQTTVQLTYDVELSDNPTFPDNQTMVYVNLSGLQIQTNALVAGKLYFWRVKSKTANTSSRYSNITSFVPGVETAVEDKATPPQQFALEQNYPNPFNPSTIIRFSIAEPCDVQLEIFSSLGQSIMLLVNQQMIAGNYEKEFDAHHLGTGVYFYRLKAGAYISTHKMLLLK